jgi:hypothetical protein
MSDPAEPPDVKVREPRRQQCDAGCGTEIVDYYGALTLGFMGGYGMFFDDIGVRDDPFDNQPVLMTICHDCTWTLFEFSGIIPEKIAEAMHQPEDSEGGKWHPDDVGDGPDHPCPWCYNWQDEVDRREAEEKSLDT